MAQPTFLRNFTLDGVDIGELFLVGTVTMPFMNIERGYYQVGNTNGQHLLYSRLGSNSISIDGTLIIDHTGLSVSETKDLLVKQLMSKDVMKLVFDAQPDRYYNVVYEGLQEYDATDLNFTPLTLQFSVPDGVAHSIKSDPFRNTGSTNENLVVDSGFETTTYWGRDTFVEPVQRNSSKVLSIDKSNEDVMTMEDLEHDFMAPDVFYKDGNIAKGATFTATADYFLVKKNSLDTDGSQTLSAVITELDTVNGKVLEETRYPIKPVSTILPVSTAYGRELQATTGLLSSDQINPNLFTQGVSEAPTVNPYMGAVRAETLNQTVPEWGAITAKKVTLTGGTHTIKGVLSSGILTTPEVEYSHSIYIKNNGTTYIIVNNNLGENILVYPKESKLLVFKPASRATGLVNAALQFTISTPAVSDNVDVTVWRAKIEVGNYTPWSDGNTATVDNTTPKYVGYSVLDDISRPSNLLLNGSLQVYTNRWNVNSVGVTFTRDSLGFSTIDKTQATTGRGGIVTGIDYTLYGSVEQGKTYTLSLDVFVASLTSGSLASSSAYMRITYADNSVVDLNLNIAQTIGSWQRLVGTITLVNKPISRVFVSVQLSANFVGQVHVKNVKLEEGSTATPYANHITERGMSYSWETYGTGFNLASLPTNRFIQQYTIKNEKTKVLKYTIHSYGDSYIGIGRPMLKLGTNSDYIASTTTHLNAVEVENLGTSTAYPTFEITNKADTKSIGIVNDDGGVLQFGNIGDVDTNPPKENQSGYFYNWTVKSKPSEVLINSGHISNYPTIYNDVDKPNLYMGSYDFSQGDIVKPKFAETFAQGAWSGPSMATPVSAPTGGNRTGAFEFYELLTFKSADDARGRYEMSVINTSNEILMSTTLRDSSPTATEILVECWLGNRLLKTLSVNLKEIQGHNYAVRMIRDSTGKKFTWRVENIVFERINGRIQHVAKTKVEYNYDSPVAIKTGVDRTSRWLLKYDDGKGDVKTLKGIDIVKRTKNILNVRTGTNTSSRSQGTVAAGLQFTTTVPQKGQSIYGNNEWYYIKKGTGVPASGWVSGYYLSEVSRKNVYDTKRVDVYTVMNINDSLFTWLGNDNQTTSSNPFRAGDEILIDTFTKRIFVNGSEREDLSIIGNQWDKFALDTGTHYIRIVNGTSQVGTLEVTTRVQRRYL